MWTEVNVDGLPVRLSAQPEDRHTRTIHTADIHQANSDEWLATAFRLQFGEESAGLRSNHRWRTTLEPRRDLLLKTIFQFQADIRAGEVQACIEHPQQR